MLYQIINEAGLDMGLYDAESPSEALAAYCAEAGAPVSDNGETIRPASPERIAQGPYAQNTYRAATELYNIVASKDDAEWVVGWSLTLEDAEKMQARLYCANPGTDYTIVLAAKTPFGMWRYLQRRIVPSRRRTPQDAT
ncbi:MAG TPA: hypothetical protein VG125_07125 [Pirellulales bacterium]|jgi:hypothetical protein|nr:hypothetical protein [Pirellulales bacterium]